MPQTVLKSVPFRPSAPITGAESFIFRGENALLRGQQTASGLFYAAYNGSNNLEEPLPHVALTGALTLDTTTKTIMGSGTAFQDELHIGQVVYISGSRPLVVNQIISPTEFLAYLPPTVNDPTSTAYRTPNIFALDVHRASLLWGNATLTDKGNIIAVGDGTLYLDGAVLAGESLHAKRRAQVALYNGAASTYSVEDLGFEVVPQVTNPDITVLGDGSGTKNMKLGFYSFRIAYYSDLTDGVSNPTPNLLYSGLTGYEVKAANSRFNIDFTADVGTRPTKATGYVIYASRYSGSSDFSATNAIEGGWFEYVRVPFTDLVAETYKFDYVDAELSTTLVTFDNDLPPDAEWVSLFTGYVNLISTNGKGVNSTDRTIETSPGPLISTMAANNIDAYPAAQRVPTEKGETIIGFLNAAGRMFPMTPNTLQASTPTGLPESPFTLRPFWQRGFASPNNLTFIDDTLYGFTTKGPYRSIATGDSASESNDFASSVNAQMADWNPGYVFVETDPKNSCVCYFHSACSQNDAGYWETEIYLYSLIIFDWMPRILLTSSTRDMIVTSTAKVHNELCFVAGGRRLGDTDEFSTFSFDTGTGDSVPWFLAFSYLDGGVELIQKILRKLRVKGAVTSGKIQVFIVSPDSDIDVDDLMSGNNPAFEIALDTSAVVKQYEVIKTRVKGLMWAIRIEGTSISDGTLESLDQVHEILVSFDVSGQER